MKGVLAVSRKRPFAEQPFFGYATHSEVTKMMIGYARVSKADGTQTTNLQSDTNRS